MFDYLAMSYKDRYDCSHVLTQTDDFGGGVTSAFVFP